MDFQSANNLINNTFLKEFDIFQFKKFLTELFNKTITREDVRNRKKGYLEYINEIKFLGTYEDNFGDRIGFYVVEISEKSSLNNARTMQRNLISEYMTNHGAALVAFYEKDSLDWRFSYIKKSYEWKNGNLKEKLSSPKRHSFLVGPNEPNHTCSKQFINLLIDENDICLTQIEDAFDIENVTDAFFDEYKKLFLELKESLENVVENDDKVAGEFELCKISTSDFSKKLLGQIVFLYFLQKKGWLGVAENKKWGEGSPKFLNHLFNKEIKFNLCENGIYNNFFNDVLEPLFYDGFCEPSNDNHFSSFGFKVPFLNGGLFEPMNNYDWENTDILLDNSIFNNIFNVFNKFNFTVKEDEPLEKEVAVDPEMLGKIFEKLLDDRKSKGAFYTPRPIVHYICQQCLLNYLSVNTQVPFKALKNFVENGDSSLEKIVKNQKDIEKLKNKDSDGNVRSHYFGIDIDILKNSGQLYELLSNIKVIDPAVGSGAFPVGMMNEIVKLMQILLMVEGYFNISIYDLKRATIENSLYCVDVEPSAIDITKLRFWLSLVVDEDNIENIRPLPNLDNHVVCGDSLVDEFEGVKLFDTNLLKAKSGQITLVIKKSEIEFQKLENKKQDFFNEKIPSEKLKLKKEIEEIKWNFIIETLKESNNSDKIDKINLFRDNPKKPFFIWELEFSEVFSSENPGFDVVIGNPPYVDIKELDNDVSNYIFSHYETSSNRINLYSTFVEKSFYLLKDEGSFSFIIPNSILFNSSYQAIRLKLLNETNLTNIVRVSDDTFEDAEVEPIILTFINSQKDKYKTEIIICNDDNTTYSHYTNQDLWINDDSSVIAIYATEETINLVNKIEFNSKFTLGDYCEFCLGLTPYDKAKGMSKKDIDNRIFHDTFKRDETFKKLLDGSDIIRYNVKWGEKEYISYGPWLGAPREQKFFTNPRILVRQILSGKHKRIYAGYTSDELYNAQVGFNLLLNSDKNINFNYLLGIINSKLMSWYHEEKYIDKNKDTYPKILIENAKKLPIYYDKKKSAQLIDNVSLIQEKSAQLKDTGDLFRKNMDIGVISSRNKLYEFWKLSEADFIKALNKKREIKLEGADLEDMVVKFNENKNNITLLSEEINYLDNEIDKIVYEIYGLTVDEINLIEKSFN